MPAPTNAAGFPVRVKTAQQNQVTMHLPTLDELIREDHPVRNIWRYVESLDLSAFYQDWPTAAIGRRTTCSSLPPVIAA